MPTIAPRWHLSACDEAAASALANALGLPPLVARYQASSDLAWPQAMAAFGKIGGKDMEGIDPNLLRPMMGPMIAGAIAQDIKPTDCPTIDRAISLMAPLPPANTAGLIVLFAASAGGKDKKDSPLTICPAAAVAATARP